MYFRHNSQQLLCFSAPHPNIPISFGQGKKKPDHYNLPQRVESFSADHSYFPEAAGEWQRGCQLNQYVLRRTALQLFVHSVFMPMNCHEISHCNVWFCFTRPWKVLNLLTPIFQFLTSVTVSCLQATFR